MKEEIQKILAIVTQEQKLNEERYFQLSQRFDLRIDKLTKIVVDEMALNASRYQELKSSIDEINRTIPLLATKRHVDYVFESLSKDITSFALDQSKLKNRLDLLEKRVTDLEIRVP